MVILCVDEFILHDAFNGFTYVNYEKGSNYDEIKEDFRRHGGFRYRNVCYGCYSFGL